MGSEELVDGSTCALAVAMAAASTTASSPRSAAGAAGAGAEVEHGLERDRSDEPAHGTFDGVLGHVQGAQRVPGVGVGGEIGGGGLGMANPPPPNGMGGGGMLFMSFPPKG